MRKKEDICPNHSQQVFFPRPNSQPLGLPANFTSLSHFLCSSSFVSQFLKVRDNHHGRVILGQFGSYKKERKKTWVLLQELKVATTITTLRFC